MGRLCFEVNELDGWQVIPFLKGIARSGKSTLITKVARKFYECEDVATLSNNIEKKFGLQSIYKGFMFISPEIKGDLQLEQAEFQSLVSGEDVSVARKNETALSFQWKTPGILGGNEVPNWKDNSGSVLRRLATWNFGRQVMDADPHLDVKLEAEIPAILCKCLRAYLDYSNKYSDQDIWNVLPKYFKDIRGTHRLENGILMSHIPVHPSTFGKAHKVNVHGHIHDKRVTPAGDRYPDIRYFCVSCEHINYTPMELGAIEIEVFGLDYARGKTLYELTTQAQELNMGY
jgi:hypothetical protein